MIETSIYSLLTAAISASVPLASMKISAVDGSAFIDCGSLGALVFARPGELLTVTDSAGNKLTGYIKAAGTGETLSGTELFSNCSDWTGGPPPTGWTASGGTLAAIAGGQAGNCLQVTQSGASSGYGVQANAALSAGALFKLISAWHKNGSAGGRLLIQCGAPGYATQLLLENYSDTDWADKGGIYRTVGAVAGVRIGLGTNGIAGQTSLWDTLSVQQVTAPAATGVTIVSTLGGSTFNWTSKDAAFNYADPAGYTISRPLSGRVYPVVMSQDVILPAISYQRISADPANTLSGASGLVNAHIVINSWARTYDEAKALALEVRTAMNAATAFKSLLVNELDGYDPDVMLFVVSQDFSVWGSE